MKNEVQVLQKRIDELVALLPQVNFSNSESVIIWLEAFAKVNEHPELKIPTEKILATFHKHGHRKKPTDLFIMKHSNHEELGKWVIGEAIAMLEGSSWNQYHAGGRIRCGLFLPYVHMWRRKKERMHYA
ncbi:hypothetical protein H6758_04135 [Candidatus Nomurabacteria bacterium]|nr:hypothetical protein [Candidatus Nomurabacteria bacterium]